MPDPAPTSADRARLALAGGIVALACLRAMVMHAPLPFWDADPLSVYTSVAQPAGRMLDLTRALSASPTGLGPTWSILLDGLTLLLAGSLILTARAIPRGPLLAMLGAGVSSVAIVVHATTHAGDSLDHARIGLAWMSAMFGALALWSACSCRRTRAIMLGLLLAFTVVLTAKGLTQVLIEHARTVASYRAEREAFLASKGWSPDSPSARAYERRLMQREATGWFGLANVYATFAGAACAAGAGALLARRQEPHSTRRLFIPGALTIIGGVALVISASKGGIASALLAVALGVVLTRAPARLARHLTPTRISLLAIVCVLLPLLATLARGPIGEALSERSLLFRFYYLQGAARVIAEHPALGVGPAGFQTAYALHKPPLSPEEVTSPHSFIFDALSALGIFGLALCMSLGAMVLALARGLAHAAQREGVRASGNQEPATQEGSAWTGRPRWYAIALPTGVAFALALWLERGASLPLVIAGGLSNADPVSMGALVAGLVLTLALAGVWIFLAERIARIAESPHPAAITLSLGALVIAIHAQIEMTLVQPASAALALAWIGTAIPPARAGAIRAVLPRVLGASGPMLLMFFALLLVLPRVATWEARLADAAAIAAPVGEARADLRSIARTPPAIRAEPLRALSGRVAAMRGAPVEPSMDAIARALDDLALVRGERAELLLDESHEALGGTHSAAMRAQVRLLWSLADLAANRGDALGARAMLVRGLARGERWSAERPSEPGAWSMLGTTHARLAEFSDGPAEAGVHLDAARSAWAREFALDPTSLSAALRLMDVSVRLGDEAGAAEWARTALRLDHLLRLDPIRQMGEGERREVQRLGGGR